MELIELTEESLKARKARMEDLEFLYCSCPPYSQPYPFDDLVDQSQKHRSEKWWIIAESFNIERNMTEEEIEWTIIEARANYGLCFDYVPSGTFSDQKAGYFRYQFSWGGPSEELRYYVDAKLSVYKVEFWFLEWFDGHGITLEGKYLDIAMNVWDNFLDIGIIEELLRE